MSSARLPSPVTQWLRRTRRTRLLIRDTAYVLAGVLVVGLVAYAFVANIATRETARLQRRGTEALVRRDLTVALRQFEAVLRREPFATRARSGRACVLWLHGRRSAAARELVTALNDGLPLASTDCGHGVHLARYFARVQLGSGSVLVVPRPTGAAVARLAALRESPSATRADFVNRMLVSGCLSLRAELDSLAWLYVGQVVDDGLVTARRERDFFACLGPTTLHRLGCARPVTLVPCLFTERRRAQYFEDMPFEPPPPS